jgi:hypothetical protein
LGNDQLIFIDYLLTEKFAAKRPGFSGASSGGRNPAEQHLIPIHPLGAPWPPRSIQGKMLIAISESTRSVATEHSAVVQALSTT